MQTNRFVETVRNRTDLNTDDDAETVTTATLRTLGVRIAEGQMEDLADRLPDELAGVLSVESEGATELFVERVDNEETEAGIEGDTEAHVRAVLETLAETADDEWDGVAAQLPESYDRLMS